MSENSFLHRDSSLNKIKKGEWCAFPVLERIQRTRGVHSSNRMKAAGFSYTGIEDTALCQKCGLEVSDWTIDMEPFTIHKQRSPQCSYVRSILPKDYSDGSGYRLEIIENNRFKEDRQKTIERARSFYAWPSITPSRRLMFLAGWTILLLSGNIMTQCMYCDARYDNWQLYDDPFIIHSILSPSCPYVLSFDPIVYDDTSRKKTINKLYTPDLLDVERQQPVSDISYPSDSHYMETPKRIDSFREFPSNLSTEMVEVLAKSGFYYCAKQSTRVQCFCCFGYIDDFHRFSINEINSTHLTRFPYCRHAQLSPQPGEKQSNSSY